METKIMDCYDHNEQISRQPVPKINQIEFRLEIVPFIYADDSVGFNPTQLNDFNWQIDIVVNWMKDRLNRFPKPFNVTQNGGALKIYKSSRNKQWLRDFHPEVKTYFEQYKNILFSQVDFDEYASIPTSRPRWYFNMLYDLIANKRVNLGGKKEIIPLGLEKNQPPSTVSSRLIHYRNIVLCNYGTDDAHNGGAAAPGRIALISKDVLVPIGSQSAAVISHELLHTFGLSHYVDEKPPIAHATDPTGKIDIDIMGGAMHNQPMSALTINEAHKQRIYTNFVNP